MFLLRWPILILWWLTSVKRTTYLGLVGSLLLMGVVWLPWSSHPNAARSFVAPNGELVLRYEMHVTEFLTRAVCFCTGCFVFSSTLHNQLDRPSRRRALWGATAFIAAFPTWLYHWDVDSQYDGRVLFREMDRVIRDMEQNFTDQQIAWRTTQDFTPDTRNDISIMRPAERTWTANFFAPGEWDRPLKEFLGWSSPFFGFIRPPAVLAVLIAGVGMLMMAMHIGRPAHELFRGLRLGIAIYLGLIAIALVPRCIGEYYLILAEEYRARGEYTHSLHCYHKAGQFKPSLTWSWWYYSQIGEIHKLQNRYDTFEANLTNAYNQLDEKKVRASLQSLYRARNVYADENGERIHEAMPLLLGAVLVEAGLDAFEDGQYGLARERFHEAIHNLPINPMPWYGLALIHWRLGEFDQAADCLEKVDQLHQTFGFRKLTTRSQYYLARAWAAYHHRDLAKAHEWYCLGMNPEGWK